MLNLLYWAQKLIWLQHLTLVNLILLKKQPNATTNQDGLYISPIPNTIVTTLELLA